MDGALGAIREIAVVAYFKVLTQEMNEEIHRNLIQELLWYSSRLL